MPVILVICALVGGFFLLKYFNKIDRVFFGQTDGDYESFGVITVAVCTFAGAFSAGGEFMNRIFDADWNMNIIHGSAVYVGIVCLAYCVFSAITRMHSAGATFGKIFFLWVYCGIGAVIGALGAIAVICALIIAAICYIIIAMAGNGKSGKRWRLEDGTVVKESSGLFGDKSYHGNDGKDYEKTGHKEFTPKG